MPEDPDWQEWDRRPAGTSRRPEGSSNWDRLGVLLQQRRVQIDPAYRNRSRFAAERGINYRLIQDIENHARDNFDVPTLTLIEIAYLWEPGSIRAVLDGGDPQVMSGLTRDEMTAASAYIDTIRRGNGDNAASR